MAIRATPRWATGHTRRPTSLTLCMICRLRSACLNRCTCWVLPTVARGRCLPHLIQLPGVPGVIALEPYADAAEVIRRAPASGLFGPTWLASWISPQQMDKAIARASRQLHVDLAHLDPGNALAHTSVCTLLLRGADDVLISAVGLRALRQRSPRTRYVEVSEEGHLSLPLCTDRPFPPLLDGIDALPTNADGACPPFTPLPSVKRSSATPGPS